MHASSHFADTAQPHPTQRTHAQEHPLTTEQTHQADTDALTGRPDKHDYAHPVRGHWAVHGGNRADETTGAIRTPIVMANSYLLPEDPTTIDDPDSDGLVYTRESGANQRGLRGEARHARPRRGRRGVRHRHGRPARHVLHHPQPRRPRDRVQRRLHARRRTLLDTCCPPSSASRSTSSTSPTSTPSAPRCDPNTRLIHTEVIANPDLRVADIAALAAHRPRRTARCSPSTPPSPRRR